MVGDHCHALFLDYLYGLLDPADADKVRTHAETCAECGAALALAQAHKLLMGRAARVLSAVPVFTAPGQALGPASAASAQEPPSAATLPIPGEPTKAVWR